MTNDKKETRVAEAINAIQDAQECLDAAVRDLEIPEAVRAEYLKASQELSHLWMRIARAAGL